MAPSALGFTAVPLDALRRDAVRPAFALLEILWPDLGVALTLKTLSMTGLLTKSLPAQQNQKHKKTGQARLFQIDFS
ncbi:hypothetical protein [Shewanella sp.]|uniref:hypothetical protein n=1 Tax=Shewanella sp. TaxID=50422 RepID=UPI003563CEF7